MTTRTPVETIRKTVTVALPAEQAFVIFTEEITSWWPLDTHSYGGEATTRAVFEGRAGGRLYEVQADGREADWATVTEWDPPHGFLLDWEITPSEVEVRFTPENGSTRIDLEHRGLERAGADAGPKRERYDEGWDHVLGRLVARSS